MITKTWETFPFDGSKVKLSRQTSSNGNEEEIIEKPPHDKTNKVTVRPAKTQISLGIPPG